LDGHTAEKKSKSIARGDHDLNVSTISYSLSWLAIKYFGLVRRCYCIPIMSFFNNIGVKGLCRDEEIRSAFQTLNQNILRHGYNPVTPPESPGQQPSNHIPLKLSSYLPTTSASFQSHPRNGGTNGSSNHMQRYDRWHPYTTSSTSDVQQENNRLSTHASSWSHKHGGSCTCCSSQRSFSEGAPMIGREEYYRSSPPSHHHTYHNSNIHSAAILNRSKDSLPLSPNAAIPISLKRRYEETLTSDPQPPPTPAKRMKLGKDNDKIACQVNGILSLPGSREPK